MMVAGGEMGFNLCSGPWDGESKLEVMASFTIGYSIPEGEVTPPVLKEMSSEFIKGEHKADTHRWKSLKVIWKKDGFRYLSTATNLMQLMVLHVTMCSSWAEKGASPIRTGMKKRLGRAAGDGMGTTRKCGVYQVSLLPLSLLITPHKAPAGNHFVSNWITAIL